jgi:HAD superfamily hydrolase (TIGR01458 family)
LDGDALIAGAVEAVAALRARRTPLLFATNTSRRSRAAVAATLSAAGLPVAANEILNAGWAAAERLRSAGVTRVHLLLTPDAAADWPGFEIVDDRAEAVVVGDMGRLFDFDRLERAFRCLRGGARLIAAHKNAFWKSVDGWTLDAGAFVVALEYASGARAEVIGKPAPMFFETAARMLGVETTRMSIVGDDLDADIAGGRAAGLTTWLVRTGKFRPEDLARVARDRAPHHIVDSVRDLVAAIDAGRLDNPDAEPKDSPSPRESTNP